MKTFILTLSLAVLSSWAVSAQSFNVGISGGIPVGDAGDLTTFAMAIDLGYILEITEEFEAGPMVGFQHFFGDSTTIAGFKVELDDVSFIPVGGTANYYFGDFGVSLDLGYAIGVSDGNDGGFYWAPGAQYGVTDLISIIVDYRNIIADGATWSNISAGVEFSFQ